MQRRQYYSERIRRIERKPLEFEVIKRLFLTIVSDLQENGFFQEYFGYSCVDEGEVPGSIGIYVNDYIYRKLRKDNIWPVQENFKGYTEDDLFDTIEFLFDHVSEPIDGRHHTFANCGWHYHTFDKKRGQEAYLNKVNELLLDYKDGFQLDENGYILQNAESGFETLYDAKVPSNDEMNVTAKVEDAKLKFRRVSSTWSDRKDALRELGDVLEFLRDQLKLILNNKDESDLFNILNKFGIRHHNPDQQKNYDRGIFYSWMFYYYLASIHACVRLLEKNKKTAQTNN